MPRAAVDVLGRRTIEPRSTIYVVRVGGKILLLGSSPHGLNTLSEITDPIEVAALANQCRAVESPSKSLVGWLKTLAKRKSDRDPQPFADRLGQSLFQQAEQAGRTTTRVSVRGQREEDRHA